MVQTPVGARCPDCAQVRRIPTYNLGRQTFVMAIGAALVGGIAVGIAWAFFNPITYIFYGIIAALAIGFAIGQLVSLASKRRAGPPLQAIAVAGVVVAYAVRVAMLFVLDDWVFADLREDIFGIIVAAVAGFFAAGRLR